ncbi:Protein of unknown function [Pyronema omphalodes CBS 100304]|uniref:Uncharacterized protein n=1 Tax=Pyronema omphalodes (strain CBS 100304) TaxID=1076935 RepID=U4L3Q4_PYROM|nr:Protein of unknown function [Pyronema omphalodes CBS 100304]
MAEPPSERTKVHTQNKTGGEEHPSEDNSAALLAPVVKNSVSQSGIAVDISAQPKPQAEKSVSGESDKKSPQDTITEISAQENLVPRLDSGDLESKAPGGKGPENIGPAKKDQAKKDQAKKDQAKKDQAKKGLENANGNNNIQEQRSGWHLKITNSDVAGAKSVDAFDIVLVQVCKEECWDWLVDLFETVTDGPVMAGYTKTEAAASPDLKLPSRQKQTNATSKQTPTAGTTYEARILQFQLQSKSNLNFDDLATNLRIQLSNERKNAGDETKPIIFVGGKSTVASKIMHGLFNPEDSTHMSRSLSKSLGIDGATAAVIFMNRDPPKSTEDSTASENNNGIGSSENLNHDIELNQSTQFETGAGTHTSFDLPDIKVLYDVIFFTLQEWWEGAQFCEPTGN